MKKKINELLKIFKAGGYSAVSFDINFGDRIRNYTIESATEYVSRHIPKSPVSFNMTVIDVDDSGNETHINTVKGDKDSLPKILECVDPFDEKDIISVIATSWDEEFKLVYVKKHEVILQRDQTWYKAICADGKFVTFSELLCESPETTPTHTTTITSHFPTFDVIVVTNGKHIYPILHQSTPKRLISKLLNSMEDMI